LAALRRRFAVIGGLAVSARAEPRLTRDVDLAVAVRSDADAEALINRLFSRGYTLIGSVEQEATGRLATARLRLGDSGIVIDLLFASSGIEPELVAAAEKLELLPGLKLPVARVGDLIALKLLARDDRRRPQDADDLRALIAEATPTERRRAKRSVTLISRRGYARGRDLAALLTEAFAGA
jgi:predicted nucleotidyltransferase